MRQAFCVTCCCAALMAGSAGAAAAQEGADSSTTVAEILVTATKTGATNIQETPIAITAITSDLIEQSNIHDIRDLSTQTPNLVITSNGSFAQVYIRGVGSNNIFAGSDPSSTVHLDGVYIARPAAYLNSFLDVERIEVLRGPQGTLYGRNSVGGTINVISRKPGNEFEAKAQLTAGNFSLFRGEAYVSGPLVQDRVAASLAVMRSTRDGYIENIFPGGEAIDSEDVWALRGQLRFTPADNFEFLVRADYMETDDIGGGTLKLLQPSPVDPLVNTTLGDYDRVALNTEGTSARRVWGLSGEASWDINESMKLTSLTAYRESLLNSQSDTDGTSLLIRITKQLEEQHQFSEELNLSGNWGDRLTYVVGAYYFDEHMLADSTVSNFVPGVRIHPNPTVDTSAWAVYGQGNFNFTDQFSITAGMRYTQETKEFNQNFSQESIATGNPLPTFPRIYRIEDEYTAWTPKLGAEFRATEDFMLYASVTRGFKSGGFNFASANPAQGYSPEYLWSYEAGFKSDLLDNRLRLNGTVFHYKYTDLQVQSFLTPGVIDITNASDAKVTGVEIEVVGKPAAGLEIGGYLAYLDAVYENYPGALKPGNIPFDASGQTINSAPKWSYTAYAQHRHELGDGSALIGRIEYNWRDRQFFTPENNLVETQKEYGLLNANVGYASPGGRWQVYLYGRNLTDTDYVTTTATFTGVVSGRVGEPRTFGIRLIAEY